MYQIYITAQKKKTMNMFYRQPFKIVLNIICIIINVTNCIFVHQLNYNHSITHIYVTITKKLKSS